MQIIHLLCSVNRRKEECKNMWLSALLFLISVGGFLCEPFECFKEHFDTCDSSLVPKDYPDTAEELRTICRNIQIYGSCLLEVRERCDFDYNHFRKTFDYLMSLCEEENPIYKVISSNIGCIAPYARKMDDVCNISKLSDENWETYDTHLMPYYEGKINYTVVECLDAIWDVSCPSITLGIYCGEETQETVRQVLETTNHRYTCTKEMREEFQPMYEVYESIIRKEVALKHGLEKRK